METKEKVYLTVGLFVLIAAVGITYNIAEGDDAYFCEVENTVGLCFKLSKVNDAGLQTRCYYNEDLPTKYNYCKSGWFVYEDPTVTGELVKAEDNLIIEKIGDLYKIYVLKEEIRVDEIQSELEYLDYKLDYYEEAYTLCVEDCPLMYELDEEYYGVKVDFDDYIVQCNSLCEFDNIYFIGETNKRIDELNYISEAK